jgi:hypothetical protein
MILTLGQNFQINTDFKIPDAIVAQLARIKSQQDNIVNLADRRYGEAYQLLNHWAQAQNNLDPSLKLFFSQVSDVNQNRLDSPANIYIREVTRRGLEESPAYLATPVSQRAEWLASRIQTTSSRIADGILSDIADAARHGGFPIIDSFIARDASTAVNTGGQTWAGWGGALFFLDKQVGSNGQTLAKLIFGFPEETEKFTRITSAANEY